MNELLLELFSEEIPATMQNKAAVAYEEIFAKYFEEQGIGFDSIKVYATPRRLTIHVSGIASYIQPSKKEIKGPKTSAPENAILGFCHSNGISKEALLRQEIKGVEYFIYEQTLERQQTKDILKNTLANPISAYVWSKSMFWGDYQIKWVRPLRNILCIFDGKVIDFTYGHLTANNISFGHRFMSPESFEVSGFVEYKQKLVDNFVMLDSAERKKYIWDEASKLAAEKGLVIKEDNDLLEEVTGLVEYPQVLLGKIDPKFLSVPSEVLISSMRSHQKYFSLFDKDGNFAPYFLFVSNIKAPNPELIIQGNEKVLAARLSDALYFYNKDLETTLKEKTKKLDKIIFHAKLGTVAAKVERVAEIAFTFGGWDVKDAALLCKGDIVSEVVGEFPDLQGIMGYYYAKHESLSEDIAIAIRDHYKPAGANDTCPSGMAAYLALADKIDTLCGLILAGEKPTGSKDPFALRRQALGIIRIILENGLQINLIELVDKVVEYYKDFADMSLNIAIGINEPFSKLSPEEKASMSEEVANNLIKMGIDNCKNINLENVKHIIPFLEERARHYLKDQYSLELVNAVLDFNTESSLLETKIKLDALLEFSKDAAWADLLVAYKRASNIVADFSLEAKIDESLFDNVYERNLYSFIKYYEPEIKGRNYIQSLKMLADILAPISRFFDNVMVKVDDKDVANNRLLLLKSAKQIFDKIAKFDQL